jgi:hypothetical protein
MIQDFTIELHNAIQAICPIEGVAIGDSGDKTTWRIDFLPRATLAQRQTAQAVLDTFAPSLPKPSIVSQIAVLSADQALKDILTRLAGGR